MYYHYVFWKLTIFKSQRVDYLMIATLAVGATV